MFFPILPLPTIKRRRRNNIQKPFSMKKSVKKLPFVTTKIRKRHPSLTSWKTILKITLEENRLIIYTFLNHHQEAKTHYLISTAITPRKLPFPIHNPLVNPPFVDVPVEEKNLHLPRLVHLDVLQRRAICGRPLKENRKERRRR